jgi:hypothetical protein
MIKFTDIEFENKFGYPLTSKKAPEILDAFINKVCEIIYFELEKYNFEARKLSGILTTRQTEAIKNAELLQAKYMIDNGDIIDFSGYEMFTNTTIQITELQKRYLAPSVLMTLRNAGLLYRGF